MATEKGFLCSFDYLSDPERTIIHLSQPLSSHKSLCGTFSSEEWKFMTIGDQARSNGRVCMDCASLVTPAVMVHESEVT